MADFEEAGDDDVLRKVSKDFKAKGVAQSDQQIRQTMDALMAQAIEQIKAGKLPVPAAAPAAPSFNYPWFQPDGDLPGYSLARRLAPARPFSRAGARCRRRSSPR